MASARANTRRVRSMALAMGLETGGDPGAVLVRVAEAAKSLSRAPLDDTLGPRFFSARLGEGQEGAVEKICAHLYSDYHLRRDMLLRRLEASCDAFTWSAKGKAFEDKLKAVLVSNLPPPLPRFTLFDVYAARYFLAKIRPSSSTRAGRKTAKNGIKELLMTQKVPDRGGRVGVGAGGASNMPAFRPRTAASAGAEDQPRNGPVRSNRGGRGGGRGGRGGGNGNGGGNNGGGAGGGDAGAGPSVPMASPQISARAGSPAAVPAIPEKRRGESQESGGGGKRGKGKGK
jgi:hypothetical protein